MLTVGSSSTTSLLALDLSLVPTIMAEALHLNGAADAAMDSSTPGFNLRFSSGLILPPPDIKGLYIRAFGFFLFCFAAHRPL